MSDDLVFRMLVAGVGGLAIGIEREWSLQARGRARFAGVRTFFMLGMAGGIAGELSRSAAAPAVAMLCALAAFVVVAYAMAVRDGDLDGTTEMAALLVVGTSFLAGTGGTAAASAIYAVTALALSEKSRIHELVRRTPEPALQAAFRFAVLALVILPLLPEGPYGPPPGIRPAKPGSSCWRSPRSASPGSSPSISRRRSSVTASADCWAGSSRRRPQR